MKNRFAKMSSKLIFILTCSILFSFSSSMENLLIKDEKTAIKIAKAIWIPIYGKKVKKFKPYDAELIGDSLWIVTGNVPEGQKGAQPRLELDARNCEVLHVSFGK